jgi:hypothetical protein
MRLDPVLTTAPTPGLICATGRVLPRGSRAARAVLRDGVSGIQPVLPNGADGQPQAPTFRLIALLGAETLAAWSTARIVKL